MVIAAYPRIHTRVRPPAFWPQPQPEKRRRSVRADLERVMSRTVFVNGSFLPLEQAPLSIMDRGFLFADGIYEVTAVVNGCLVDNAAHLARLDRCLNEVRIPNPYSAQECMHLEEELVHRNELREGTVYIQVTRGVAERDF